MAVTTSVYEGMRLTHTTHGDGRVKEIQDRVNPKTKAVQPYARIAFSASNGRASWSSLLNGEKLDSLATDTSLVLFVPVSDMSDSPNWYVAEDYGDLSDIIVDIERLATKNSSIMPPSGPNDSAGTQLVTLGKNLENADLSPAGDPINVLKVVVDWSAERLIRQIETNSRTTGAKLSDVNEWIPYIENRKFWSNKIYPNLPEVVRSGADKVLVSVTVLISNSHGVEMHEAAKMLAGAIENRVFNLHHRSFTLAKSRLEAKLSKVVVN